MKDYYRAIALVTVLLVAVMAAWTQGGGSAPAASPTKTGVLNVRQAIVSTSEGKQASAELQSQFSPRQNELENLNKQIEDVRSRLSAGARTLSDEEKTRLTRDGEKLARQLQRKQQELEEEVNTAQGEVFDRIGRKRSEEHTSELQSQSNLVCRLLLEKKKKNTYQIIRQNISQ